MINKVDKLQINNAIFKTIYVLEFLSTKHDRDDINAFSVIVSQNSPF